MLLMTMSPKTIDRLLAREREVPLPEAAAQPAGASVAVPTGSGEGARRMGPAGSWESAVGLRAALRAFHGGRVCAHAFGDRHCQRMVGGQSRRWGDPRRPPRRAWKRLRQRVPFRVREVHPDNDSGIFNDLLWNYCRRHRIRMSRSRPYQKNDNAWVEQKNWTHVRKVVGYRRFTTEAQCAMLGELYEALADFRNFFQPAMKLKEKVRVGGKIRRVYEAPRTPYQRVLELGQLKPKQRRHLEQRYRSLDPVELRRRIDQAAELSCGIWPSARTKRRCPSIAVTARPWISGRESGNAWPKEIDVGRQSTTSFGAPGQHRPADFALYFPKASARKLHQIRGSQNQNPQNGHHWARFDWGLGAVYSGASSVASAFVSSPGTRLPRESTSLYRKVQNALAFGYFLTWHNDSYFGYFLKWLDGGRELSHLKCHRKGSRCAK